LILGILFFIFSGFIFYNIENQFDVNLTIIESFRIMFVNFLGESYEAKTAYGRMILLIIFILGIFAVSALIGKIASVFVRIDQGPLIHKHINNHIIICNWYNAGDKIIHEIHSDQASPNINIIIITDGKINEIELRRRKYYKNVFFLRRDPMNHNVLKEEAMVHNAKSIIILSDPIDTDPDAKSVMIALAIKKCLYDFYTKKSEFNIRPESKTQIIAEVMNTDKIQHFKDAGVDESIYFANFCFGIIAQTALYGKLYDVYQQLLSYSGDTNEIYLIDNDKYPKYFQGKSFMEIAKLLNSKQYQTNPVILIGIKRNTEVILNPKRDQFDKLQAEDSLILIAFDPPNLKTIIDH